MMSELTDKLGLRHENSTPYYPQANDQVEEINKILITMLRWIIGIQKTNWHMMLFSALWAYQKSVNSSMGFTPFKLVYVIESIFLIECEIPSLKLVVKLSQTPLLKRNVYCILCDYMRPLVMPP
jgi:hypothetical protein